MSTDVHGGHNPAHSDGFPVFYVLPGKQRDYFWPNIVPLDYEKAPRPQGEYEPALTEAQSTTWYHDHAIDITAFNVSKGLAGQITMFADWELHLIKAGILPGWGEASVTDPDQDGLAAGVKDSLNPGYSLRAPGKEPFFNPFDIPIVLQDKVIDPATGQIVYDSDGHNGCLGDTFFANGVPWPVTTVGDRKYRLRILDGSNARIFRLRILSEADFLRSQQAGLSADELAARAKPFLQIGKDSWMWSQALERRSVVLSMANRADLIVDFGALVAGFQRRRARRSSIWSTRCRSSTAAGRRGSSTTAAIRASCRCRSTCPAGRWSNSTGRSHWSSSSSSARRRSSSASTPTPPSGPERC
jgi:spore coat protein A